MTPRTLSYYTSHLIPIPRGWAVLGLAALAWVAVGSLGLLIWAVLA